MSTYVYYTVWVDELIFFPHSLVGFHFGIIFDAFVERRCGSRLGRSNSFAYVSLRVLWLHLFYLGSTHLLCMHGFGG